MEAHTFNPSFWGAGASRSLWITGQSVWSTCEFQASQGYVVRLPQNQIPSTLLILSYVIVCHILSLPTEKQLKFCSVQGRIQSSLQNNFSFPPLKGTLNPSVLLLLSIHNLQLQESHESTCCLLKCCSGPFTGQVGSVTGLCHSAWHFQGPSTM